MAIRLSAVAAALILAGSGSGPAIAQQAAPAVTVAGAVVQDVDQSITYNGRVVAVQKVDLRARINGFVQELGFTEGGMVAEGDVLFSLEDDSYRFSLEQAEASVAAAEAQAQLAMIERDRQAELVARDAAAQAVIDRAEAQYQAANADMRRLQALRDQAALNLSYARITAPFAGRVGLSGADVGALVGPESGALLTLVRIDPMTVEFAVPERHLLLFVANGETHVPQDASITLTRADGSVYPENGTVNFVDVEVNPGTDTVLLRAEFPNPDGNLTDGALVSITLAAAVGAPVLTVPQRAVQRDLTGAYVLVVDDEGVVEQRRVEIGRLVSGLATITSGLEEGEHVITEGANKVRPGIVVDAALAGLD